MQVRLETPISKKNKHICTVSLIIGEFIIHNIEVRYGRKGLYLSFSPLTHPLNEESRQKCLNTIINKLKQYPEFMRLHSDKVLGMANIK